MKPRKTASGWSAMFALGLVARSSAVSAQTFESYRCADGTHFIQPFYPGDGRAYLQIDGRGDIEKAPHRFQQTLFRQRPEPHCDGKRHAYQTSAAARDGVRAFLKNSQSIIRIRVAQ